MQKKYSKGQLKDTEYIVKILKVFLKNQLKTVKMHKMCKNIFLIKYEKQLKYTKHTVKIHKVYKCIFYKNKKLMKIQIFAFYIIQ